jgi:AraC-like DNA-binding protein
VSDGRIDAAPPRYEPAGAAPGTDAHTARCEVAAPLRAHVASYFAVEVDAAREPVAVRTLPDGCADLMFELGEPPRAWLGGPRLEASVYAQRAPTRFFGVQLRPGAAHALLSVPMSGLVDAWEPLDRFLGAEAVELARVLTRTPGLAARAAATDAFLVPRFASRPVDPRVASAVDRLVESRGAISVLALARAVGASQRNLNRLFDTWVGVSPKRLARVMRFQSVIERMTNGEAPDWAALAIEIGYADQSHLVRDFAAFAGLAPSALLRGRDVSRDRE